MKLSECEVLLGSLFTVYFLLCRLAFHQHMAQPFKINIWLSLNYACVERSLSMHICPSVVSN